MKYNSPELQLVGAAQNLVLSESAPQDSKSILPCFGSGEDDPQRGIYNLGSEW